MNKRKRLSALCGCLLALAPLAAQTLKGNVMDNEGQPLSFVNVVALSLPDSTFVAGVTTGEDGAFTLDTKGTGKLLRFSLLG